MPLYSDSSNYYYSGGSSQLYSPYYSSSSSSSPGSYTSSYNRAYPGSYMVPLLPSPRSPSYTTSSSIVGSGVVGGSSSNSLLGLSSRYQPKLTTITETSALTGRHSGHSSLMPLTRIQSPKYSSVSSYGSSSSNSSGSSSSHRYIPPRPIAINTADIDVSSARYHRRSAEPEPAAVVERKQEKQAEPQEEQQQQQPEKQQQQLEQEQQGQSQAPPRRSTIRRNRAVVRLSTIRRRSKERNSEQPQQQQQQPQQQQQQPEEHQFRDLPPAAEPSLSWRQKLAEELAAFPATSNKKSPGELLRERFYIHDEKQQLAELRQQQKQQQQQAKQTTTEQATQQQQQQQRQQPAKQSDEETEESSELEETAEQVQETIRRLSLVQCPTFHDICEDISSDKIDDDLNAGELRRRASIIQEQEQELLNKLQKSNSGTFQLIHLERRSSHDSTTADESTAAAVAKQAKKRKSKKLRHKITAIVDVENAVTAQTQSQQLQLQQQQQHHMPSVLELNEEQAAIGNPPLSPKPKFTVNVETVEEHQQIHKIFKLPKKKVAPPKASQVDQVLPEGFMKAAPKAKTSPIKKPSKPKEQDQAKLLEKEKLEAEEKQLLQEKLLEEKLKQEKLQQEKLQAEKLKQEKLQEEKLKEEKLQKEEKLKQEKLQEEKLKEEKLQQEKLQQEKLLQLQKEKLQQEKLQQEKLQQEKLKQEKLEQEKKQKEKLQREKLQKEKLQQEKLQREKLEQEKVQKEKQQQKLQEEKLKQEKEQKEKEQHEKLLKHQQQQQAGVAQIFTFDEAAIQQNQATMTPTATPTPAAVKQEGVATPKPIRKAIQKSESGEDFWSQIGSRETLYMNNRKKVITDRQLETTSEEATSPKEAASATPTLKSAIHIELKQPATTSNGKSLPATPAITLSNSTPATPKLTTKSEPATPLAPTATATSSPKATPATPKLNSTTATATVAKTETSPKSTATATKTEAGTTATTAKSMAATLKPADKLATTVAKPVTTAKTTAKEQQQSGNAAVSTTTVVMTTASTIATGKSKLCETAATTTTTTAAATAAPKINTGQAAKSPEQQQAAAAKINKTTHNNERQQQQPQQQQPPSNVATSKQETETKTKLTEIVEPKSKVQSPKATATAATAKPKAAAAKKKATAAAAAAATPTTAAATETLPDSNVTPINADQFISLAPTKAAIAAATNASSPATATSAAAATTAAAAATTATAATTPTTTGDALRDVVANVADNNGNEGDDVVDNNDNDNNDGDDDNSCGEGVGNNLSKFATVSNLAQCLRDVDAELDDYIPSSAENSEDSSDDSSFDDSSSANGLENNLNLSASMKKKQRKEKKKQKAKDAKEAPARFDPQKKIKIDPSTKCYVKEEAPRYPLVATPRPLWKREKIVYSDENTDDESSSEGSEATGGSLDEETDDDDSDACSSNNSSSSEEFDDESATRGGAAATATNTSATSAAAAAATTAATNKTHLAAPGQASTSTSTSASASSSPSIIRMSTCSNDSGFEGGTAPSSPKKMLECDVNCHKKCERLTANLCGVNQKLIVEALNHVKRGAREARDSPSTPPSCNPAYKIEANDEHDETSYTYSQFQKSGRFTAPATVIPRFKNYSVDDFHFLAVLGKGSFGKVLLAELRDTTYYYAIKCLKKDVVLEDDDVDSTLIERKVLALGTKHPYLCHLFCTFQTESHLFFVMEYLNGGDLMFHIQESGRFSEERARFYGAEIISGLKFLHKKGIIYRDLKLDNVLLDYEGHVRIADFGMCKLQIYLDKTADSFCGTPDYMAPEIIKGEKYNQNVDWWSFGVLLYEMLIGQSPFSGCDEDELFWSICNEIPWFPVYISAEATGILKGLLEKDYTKRIGSQYSPAGDIADHIFFRPIEWNLLEKRQIEPPFKPQVKHPLDTQYFDRVFTRERVRLTPIDKEILASMDQKQFHGFTYTNPHITLD